jgi:perosamine synthetase
MTGEEVPVRRIPSAGPNITDKEIRYVEDAVRTGWYDNWDGYLTRFEKAFATFTANRHALSTSSCTGALHIALSALGVGPGDEVIVPETTWVATAIPAVYLGAKPVFVDVEKDTWCMNPEAFAAAITAKTKVVIPVHMYGHPAEMDEINCIAAAHDITVVEDAAPGIGGLYKGRPAGSLGRVAVFSFQGAKPIVTGEGGMVVTNDPDLFDKMHWYWDHCRARDKILVTDGIGYKYKMSNLQAALGLAQLERADEIIAKRRQIFFWYQERLGDIDGLRLNAERDQCRNTYYVPTIVLEGKFDLDAEGLMTALADAGIANRPFFRCISKFPMFEAVETPVADFLAANGVNLPCPSNLTEGEADYVAMKVRDLLIGRR